MRRWEDFWFKPIPTDVFALLRIGLGAVGLIGVLGMVPVSVFWPLDGLIPPSGEGALLRHLAMTYGLGVGAGWALFLTLVVAFVCMTIGLWSSWAVPVCFAATIVQSFWNPWPLSGAHDVLTVMLFCLLWADCSGWPSVDAWRARRSGNAIEASVQTIAPLRLMRIQMALIYMNSAFWKLFGASWRDGTTIHYVLNLNTYQRFPGALPVSLEPLLTFSTYLTLFWEMTFGLMLLNRRTRKVAIAIGVAMHVGLWVTMELGPFSWVMLASYVAFLDPEHAARIVSALRRFPVRRAATESPALRAATAAQRSAETRG